MRAKQFTEAALGTNPKRPARAGSRPTRGHAEEPRYKNSVSKDEEDQFHLKLDKLVHNTFGPSPDEVKEGADERKQNALWAQITQHEKQAKATKNDIKKQHHMKMASDLRSQLKTSDLDEIAGAFPSPSTREKWAKDAAASNAAEAKRQAALKAQQLQQNTELVDKEQKVNHHSLSPSTQPPVPIQEGKTVKQDASKPRNFVAKNAINTGAGAHKDKKKAEKQGDFKHKKQAIPMDEAMQELEAAFKEEKAPRALCISSKPDEDLGASQLASCKSQGLRARDGNKSHKLGKSPKSRVKVGGKRIKGNKYGGPLPDWS